MLHLHKELEDINKSSRKCAKRRGPGGVPSFRKGAQKELFKSLKDIAELVEENNKLKAHLNNMGTPEEAKKATAAGEHTLNMCTTLTGNESAKRTTARLKSAKPAEDAAEAESSVAPEGFGPKPPPPEEWTQKGWVDYSGVTTEPLTDGQLPIGEGVVPPHAPGIEEDVTSSISVETGIAAVEKQKLKTGHTVFTSHLAPRATKIIAVDDARGIVRTL